MNFLEILANLKSSYGEHLTYTDNGVCLLGPRQPPKIADHFIFAPMTDELVQCLVQSYRYKVPDDLLTLYTAANGMELFRTMCSIPGGFKLPTSKLSIFGVPPLANRQHLEPYNISIEDLSRLPDTPRKWLKFGNRCTMDKNTTSMWILIPVWHINQSAAVLVCRLRLNGNLLMNACARCFVKKFSASRKN